MPRRSLARLCLCLSAACLLALSAGERRGFAQDEADKADAATTVKESLADGLAGKWRAKFEIDEEKLKKEGGEAAALYKGLFEKMSLTIEFKADGHYAVNMEGMAAELGGAKTQKGKWKVLKEDGKKLDLEFFDNEKPHKMEFTFDGPDRFTLKPEEELGPLKPPVFNRVKEKDEKKEKDDKAEKPKE